MDRDKFIKEFGRASTQLNMDRARNIMKECVERQTAQNPQFSKEILPMVVMEECAELTEAISRRIRGRDTDDYSLLEEMADVLIDILSLTIIYGIPEDDVIRAVNVKLNREAERIRQWKEKAGKEPFCCSKQHKREVTVVVKKRGYMDRGILVKTALDDDSLIKAVKAAMDDFFKSQDPEQGVSFIAGICNAYCEPHGFRMCGSTSDINDTAVIVDLDEPAALHDRILFTIDTKAGKVKVSAEDIDDIMASAMNGCAYWCGGIDAADRHRLMEEGYDGLCTNELLTRGFDLEVYPFEDEMEILTLEKFKKGLMLFFTDFLGEAANPECTIARRIDGDHIDPSMIDANDADVIIQLALFGELIYS